MDAPMEQRFSINVGEAQGFTWFALKDFLRETVRLGEGEVQGVNCGPDVSYFNVPQTRVDDVQMALNGAQVKGVEVELQAVEDQVGRFERDRGPRNDRFGGGRPQGRFGDRGGNDRGPRGGYQGGGGGYRGGNDRGGYQGGGGGGYRGDDRKPYGAQGGGEARGGSWTQRQETPDWARGNDDRADAFNRGASDTGFEARKPRLSPGGKPSFGGGKPGFGGGKRFGGGKPGFGGGAGKPGGRKRM
jgi:ATP-dependent RNA helicase DeaD